MEAVVVTPSEEDSSLGWKADGGGAWTDEGEERKGKGWT